MHTGTAVPPAALAHKEAWIGMTEIYLVHFRCEQATCKCQALHAPGNAACTYVNTYTSFDAYSDRHVLGLLLCAGGIALRCAVLAVQRRTYPYILLRYSCLLLYTYGYSIRKR